MKRSVLPFVVTGLILSFGGCVCDPSLFEARVGNDCLLENDTACAVDQDAVLICDGGTWALVQECATGFSCEKVTATCLPDVGTDSGTDGGAGGGNGDGGTDGGGSAVPIDAVADTATVDEDTPVEVDVLANDGVAGRNVTVTLETAADYGTAEVLTGGMVKVTPNQDYAGTITLAYRVTDDDDGATAVADVTITVNPVNDLPAATDQTVTLDEDGTATVTLATDADGDVLSCTMTSPPTTGSASITDDTLTYTPEADANGTVTLTYVCNDGTGDSAEVTLTLDITPVADPPVAVDDDAFTTSDRAVRVIPLANDSDPDGDTLSLVSVDTPAHGTVTMLGDEFDYTPDGTWLGDDFFGYTMTDGTTQVSATIRMVVGFGGLQSLERVNVDDNSAQVTVTSWEVALSFDGRMVVFDSGSDDLVAADTNGFWDIIVRDRATDTNTVASVNTAGDPSNGESYTPDISDDGTVVAFLSQATNLATGATGNFSHVYLRDLVAGTTTLASPPVSGPEADGDSDSPSLSADGRLVAFSSDATNLVAGDANGFGDIFVHDVSAGTTTLVTVGTGGAASNGDSWQPVLSADGAYVAFHSAASNLVAGDNNSRYDVFVAELSTGTITRVSVAADGTEGNTDSTTAAINDDGSVVAFVSSATTLVTPAPTVAQAYLWVRGTPGVTVASVECDGTPAEKVVAEASLSGDGRYVSFVTASQNLDFDAGLFYIDPWVHDRMYGSTRLAAQNYSGNPPNGDTSGVSFAGGGRYLGWLSAANTFVTGDTNGIIDVFVAPNILDDDMPGRAPTGVEDAFTVAADTTTDLDVVGNDTDPDCQPLVPAISWAPQNGTAAVNPDGTIAYTPTAGYTGTDYFEYNAVDPQGNEGWTWVDLIVQ